MTTLKLTGVTLRYLKGGAEYALTIPCGSACTDSEQLTVSWDGTYLTAAVRTDAEITLLALSAAFSYIFQEDDRILLNGWQSWTDTAEHTIHEGMRGLAHIPKPVLERYAFTQYGDYNFTDYPNRRGALHGWSYGYIRSGAAYLLIGSRNERTGFTRLRTDTAANTLTAEKDCRGLTMSGEYALELGVFTGTEQEVFDAYFAMLDIPKAEAKPIFGYTSWYRHYQNISDTVLQADLDGLAAQDFHADVFQIDDGWQTAVGDWLSVDGHKFPAGMRSCAERIRAAGCTPGIWIAPFVCEAESELFRSHPGWLLYDEQHLPVRAGSNWSGSYVLDIYNEEVRAYLRHVFEVIVREWGFSLLKLDFLYAACIRARQDRTRGQIMFEAMDFLREIAGDAQILACGVPLAAAFGKAAYCRIGCDVSLDWDDKPYMRLMHRERISTKHAVLNAVFRRQLDGRAFRNDPDVFLLRTDNTTMRTAQKQCLAEINAMTGGVLFTSDNCAEYHDNQKQMLARMMRLREAQVLSAERSGAKLTVQFRLAGKVLTREYEI